MTKKQIIIASILALSFLAVGCTKKFKMHRESLEQKTSWQFHHSDIQSTGKTTGSFNGKLNVIWEESFGTKPSGPLSLAKGLLIIPDSRKKIRFYESDNGDYRGFLRTKGYTATGVVVNDSLGYYIDGPRKYTLRCLNLLKRKTIWEVRVKDATSGSIIVGNNLIVSLTEGIILAFDLITGEKSWSFEADNRFLAAPSAFANTIVQPADNGDLYFIDAITGEGEAMPNSTSPQIGTAVINQEQIYSINMTGDVTAYDLNPVTQKWNTKITGPVWSTPAVDNQQIYSTSNTGKVIALNANTGEQTWTFDANDVIKCSPIVVGDYIIFGTMAGKLYSLNSQDGNVIATRQFTGAFSQNPVSDGRFIYVASDEGELFCLGDSNEIATLNK